MPPTFFLCRLHSDGSNGRTLGAVDDVRADAQEESTRRVGARWHFNPLAELVVEARLRDDLGPEEALTEEVGLLGVARITLELREEPGLEI